MKFDNNISGIVIPEIESSQKMWDSFVSFGSHGYFVIGRIRRFDRFYFVKAIAPEWRSDLNVRRMLMKEFGALAKLSHPGIVNVFDYQDTSPVGPCILMEYVDGRNLNEFLHERNRSSIREDVALRLVDAMAYAHSHNIIHRDLKPENILITHTTNQVRIIDFGLADFPSNATLKRVGGNNEFSAPEQIAGALSSPEQDVYSLGKLLKKFRLPICYQYVLAKASKQDANARYRNACGMMQSLKSARISYKYAKLGIATFMMLLIIWILGGGVTSYRDMANRGIEIGAQEDIHNPKETMPPPDVSKTSTDVGESSETPALHTIEQSNQTPRNANQAERNKNKEKDCLPPQPIVFSPSWPESKQLSVADTTSFLNAFRNDAEKYSHLIIERGSRTEDINVLYTVMEYYNLKTGIYLVEFPSFKKKFREIEHRITKTILSRK